MKSHTTFFLMIMLRASILGPSVNVPLENILIPDECLKSNKCEILKEISGKKPLFDSSPYNFNQSKPKDGNVLDVLPADLKCALQEYLKSSFLPDNKSSGFFNGICDPINKSPIKLPQPTFQMIPPNPIPVPHSLSLNNMPPPYSLPNIPLQRANPIQNLIPTNILPTVQNQKPLSPLCIGSPINFPPECLNQNNSNIPSLQKPAIPLNNIQQLPSLTMLPTQSMQPIPSALPMETNTPYNQNTIQSLPSLSQCLEIMKPTSGYINPMMPAMDTLNPLCQEYKSQGFYQSPTPLINSSLNPQLNCYDPMNQNANQMLNNQSQCIIPRRSKHRRRRNHKKEEF